MRCFIAACVALLCFLAQAFAYGGHAAIPSGQFYVSTNGNDSTGTGGLGAPYATPGKAQTEADAMFAGGICPTAEFEGGSTAATAALYPVASTWAFTAADSGNSACLPTYQPVPGQYAVISGGTQLSGWSLCMTADSVCNSGSNGIYEASGGTLSIVQQIYVNGVRYVRAHGSQYPSGWTLNSSGLDAPDGTVAGYGNLTSVAIGVQAAYAEAECPISSASASSPYAVTPDSWCWTNAWAALQADGDSLGGVVYQVVNAYELLTAANCSGGGCFYWNPTTNTIFVLPTTGTNMTTATVIVPQVGPSLVTFTGGASSQVPLYIHFAHMFVSYAAMTQFQTHGYTAAFVDALCPAYSTVCSQTDTNDADFPTMAAAVETSGYGAGLDLDHIGVDHVAGECLWLAHGVQNITVTAPFLTDCGGGDLRIGDRYDAAQSTASLQTAEITVTNASLGAPQQYLLMPVVSAPYGRNVSISDVEVTGSPYVAFHLGWNGLNLSTPGYTTSDSLVGAKIDNYCSQTGNVGTHLKDCGAFHSGGGSGWTVQTSYATDAGNYQIVSGFYLDNLTTNETWGGSGTLGIVLDQGTGTGPDYWFYQNGGTGGNTLSGVYAVQTNTKTTGGSVSTPNFTSFTNGSPPAGATAIENAAGIQPGVTPGP